MRRLLLPVLCLCAAVLAACGFHLRSSDQLAGLPFKSIHLGFPETSPLGIELKRNIRAGGDVRIATDAKDADALLEVLSEGRDKVVLSLNSQGRPREYTLYYKLRFRIKDNNQRELLAPTEIVLKRDISFNESQVLAKEREEELLFRDMQSDLVQQIMRRLAAIRQS